VDHDISTFDNSNGYRLFPP